MPKVRDRKVDFPDAEGFLRFARNTAQSVAPNFPAPAKCIDAIAGAVKLPFEQGLKEERRMFVELLQSPESRAMRHAFFGERAASKIPDVPADTPVRDDQGGSRHRRRHHGRRHRHELRQRRHPGRHPGDQRRRRSTRALPPSARTTRTRLARGRLKPEDVEKRMALLKPTLSYDDIKDADIVIEAVFEDIGVKEKVFKQLDAVMKPGAILASNTSTLDVNKIAAFTKPPAGRDRHRTSSAPPT